MRTKPKILEIFSAHPFLCSGILCFFYCATIALLIQKWILPVWFPSLHANDGLLIGGDWLHFHNAAAEIAQKIRVAGWSAWELRPSGAHPSGIASIFYYFLAPKPWAFIPYNAAVHALSTVYLMRIIYFMVPKVRVAILSALPFWFFPTSMLWYVQIHNDGTTILGWLILFYGWLMLTVLPKLSKSQTAIALLQFYFGALLIWTMRPYQVQIISAALIFPFVFLIVRTVKGFWRGEIVAPVALLAVFIYLLSPFSLTYLGKHGGFDETKRGQVPTRVVPPPQTQEQKQTPASEDSNSWMSSILREALYYGEVFVWKFMGPTARTIYSLRLGFINGSAKGSSNVDMNIYFSSLGDIVFYIPRALQIALFSPFPDQWFQAGSIASSKFYRRAAALEMFCTYLALFFLLFSLWFYRRKFQIWLMVLVVGEIMLIYSLVIVNMGTLYRMRYVFIMVLIAL